MRLEIDTAREGGAEERGGERGGQNKSKLNKRMDSTVLLSCRRVDPEGKNAGRWLVGSKGNCSKIKKAFRYSLQKGTAKQTKGNSLCDGIHASPADVSQKKSLEKVYNFL